MHGRGDHARIHNHIRHRRAHGDDARAHDDLHVYARVRDRDHNRSHNALHREDVRVRSFSNPPYIIEVIVSKSKTYEYLFIC